MLERLFDIAWNLEAQPSWNAESAVPDALRALATASAESGDAAYHRMLYALGNDHAGTYYPVVLTVTPFFAEILREGGDAARARTLDVTIDLLGSFEPEPGFDIIATPTGPLSLRATLREKMSRLGDDVERVRTAAESPEVSKLAAEFLALLHD